MIYYQYLVTGFGYILFVLMSLRLPVAWFDSRIFLRAVRMAGYSHPLWFTFQRSFMPSILGAPVILWMTPEDFFRRSPADMIWDMAMQMLDMYGPDEEEEEEKAVALYKHSDDNCN